MIRREAGVATSSPSAALYADCSRAGVPFASGFSAATPTNNTIDNAPHSDNVIAAPPTSLSSQCVPISGDLLYAAHRRRYSVSSQLTPFLFMHISVVGPSVGSCVCVDRCDVNCERSLDMTSCPTMNFSNYSQTQKQKK